MDKELLNQCIDAPDSRDWKFSEFVNFEELAQGVSSTWLRDLVKIWNQGSVGSCTDHGITHISNGYNVKERKDNGQVYTQLDPLKLWFYGDQIPSLQAGLKRQKTRGLIDGRLKIDGKTIDEMNEQMKKALSMGKLIYTGNSNGDWKATKINKVMTFRTDNKIVGHARDIVDEEIYKGEEMYLCPNSRGETRGDKGYFHLKKQDILKIYTKYVVLDHNDSEIFNYFKALQYAKEVIRVLRKLYPLSDRPVQEFFEKVGVGNFLKTYYKLEDADLI